MRSGARVGDLIVVTGELGGAAAGLKLLNENSPVKRMFSTWEIQLTRKQLFPFPKISDGLHLSKIATSMIDISDGLSSDLMHICQSSQVGAKLYRDKIPINKNISMLKKDFDEQLEFALNGGEDFELLFTVDPKNIFDKKFDSFFRIGEVTANIGIIELMNGTKTTILQPNGYRHF